ncbi:ThiF family adenylyltransferase [Cnuibacter physcomitrellae]|uniref:ThiF family adenylyltransferase n=1 Tax=Cnuibacter physcomitrellae TaxID=1619308 RepID=UPI002175BF02|nr:ThiF family adenylyltransferase [Cnuibacter physcomitrellae]MCS5496468.1 ThiF family adenylyltransferase [Cnuibacter physcomitrellae]
MALAPLVSPGPELSRAELLRYARQMALPQIGLEGQRRLKNSRVVVLGAGGLGSPVLLYLAAAGVGTIGVVDRDTVDVSNLHRQVLHPDAAVGERKVASAAAALRRLNPHIEVIEHDVDITPETVLDLVSEYDVVVDGTDTFDVQIIADAACALVGKPYVWGSVLRFDGQATVFWAQAPGGAARTLSDLYPDLERRGADADETCAIAGVLGPLCATVGGILASETLKLLGGYGEPLLGRLLVVDALDGTTTEVPFGTAEPATPRVANVGRPYDPFIDGPTAGGSPGPAARPRNERNTMQQEDASTDSVSVSELDSLLQARARGEADFVLVDVREPHEHELVSIDGSVLVPLGGILSPEAREAVPADATVIVHCHHDGRSQRAAQALRQSGYDDVRFVRGGIDAWVAEIEPEKPRY